MRYSNILLLLWKKKTVKIISALFVFFFLLNFLFPLPDLKPYSRVILSRDSTLLNAYLTPDDKWRMKTRLSEISPDLVTAILEKEDKWFYWHIGFNPYSIGRAFYKNIVGGEIVSGASTITMQVARLLEPAERTYWNKFLEILRAVQLELCYSKDDILEMYLSLVPYGGNIEGVKSASYLYFDRPPDKLSLSQSICLAIIPNDPNRLRPDNENEELKKFRDEYIRRFADDDIFDKATLNDALEEPISNSRFGIKPLAPHFCNYVNKRFRDGDLLLSTLNITIQRTAEQLLLNHVNRNIGFGITNGAVMVVDNKTSEVVAYCGSADFYNDTYSGQVNGITAIRSPGSTLKPALFAQAFDMGLLTPQMKLFDIPTDFGGYQPENYEETFNGDVTTAYALLHSLNVPSVRLLEKIEINNFLNLLEDAKLEDIADQRDRLGLSVILGGCGVRLEQLVRLYTAFSRNGDLYSLEYLLNTNEKKPVPLFSEASSFIIAEILKESTRPDLPNDILEKTQLPRIAWKTGTSYGRRDAWSIGFNPRYTIGVWMGNFDGEGSPHLIGAHTAVPLLIDLFNAIDKGGEKSWYKKPSTVYSTEVCAETGMLPSERCNNTVMDYRIENVSPMKVCDLYKDIYVNKAGTIQYCTACLPDSGYIKKAYPIYDPELTLWYEKNSILYTKPPEHNPNCDARFTGDGPKILSPLSTYEYLLEKGAETEIMLLAASDSRVKEHIWYINNEYIGTVSPNERLFHKPTTDTLNITCLDDKGRSSSMSVVVKFY